MLMKYTHSIFWKLKDFLHFDLSWAIEFFCILEQVILPLKAVVLFLLKKGIDERNQVIKHMIPSGEFFAKHGEAIVSVKSIV